MTPPLPRPPRDLDPRRVADARTGLASVSRSFSTVPFLIAAASRHSTARGSGRFATFVSRKTLRLLRFVPKLAYGLGSGRLNATTRAGASFSAAPGARGAGRSEDIDARFAASALCFRRRGGSEAVRGAPRKKKKKAPGAFPDETETARFREGGKTPGVAENRGARRSGSTRGTRTRGRGGDRGTHRGWGHVKPEPFHAGNGCPGPERVPHGLQFEREEEVFRQRAFASRVKAPGVGEVWCVEKTCGWVGGGIGTRGRARTSSSSSSFSPGRCGWRR